MASDFQYAGMYEHQTSGLNLTPFRAYDPTKGVWLSRDPLGEGRDATLYSYVRGNSVDRIDPRGLTLLDALGMTADWAAGIAPPMTVYGPSTSQTQEMMEAPGVQKAIALFNKINAGKPMSQQRAVTNIKGPFGIEGIFCSRSFTEQFVGEYRVDIYPNPSNGTISIQVSNTTSMTSLLYGIYPNILNPPNGFPMGNASQTYSWVQPDVAAGQSADTGGWGGSGGTW